MATADRSVPRSPSSRATDRRPRRSGCRSRNSGSSTRCPRRFTRSKRSSSACVTNRSRRTSTRSAPITSPRCSRGSIRSRTISRRCSRAGWNSKNAEACLHLPERIPEQRLDRFLAVRLDAPRARAGEMRMRDRRRIGAVGLPIRSGPLEPAVLFLIEDEQRLVAQLRELRAPPRSAAHRAVVEDDADDVDLLAVVDLIPERLQDLPDRGAVGVAAVHQPGHVFEAHVAALQLFVIQHADAARADVLVPVEREVDFLDAVPFRARAELRLGAGRATAEQDEVGFLHDAVRIPSSWVLPSRPMAWPPWLSRPPASQLFLPWQVWRSSAAAVRLLPPPTLPASGRATLSARRLS